MAYKVSVKHLFDWIIIYLLFGLPLTVLPFGISYFETPKVLIAQALIAVLGLIVWFRDRHRFKELSYSLSIFCLFVILFTVVRTFLDESYFVAFGNVYRLQGGITYIMLMIFTLIASLLTVNIPNVIPTIAGFGLLMSIYYFENSSTRAGGSLGEPNSLAGVGVVLLCWALFSNRLIYRILGVVAICPVIYYSGSRSGLIAAAIVGFFWILQKVQTKLSIKVALSMLMVFLSLILPYIENTYLANPGRYQFQNRVEIYQIGIKTALAHPLGVGFGNIQTVFHQTAVNLDSKLQYSVIDSAHNIFLDMWIQSGVVGLMSFIIILMLCFKNLVAQNKLLELSLLIGLLSVMQFNPVSIAILVQFWWVIAQGFLPKKSL